MNWSEDKAEFDTMLGIIKNRKSSLKMKKKKSSTTKKKSSK